MVKKVPKLDNFRSKFVNFPGKECCFGRSLRCNSSAVFRIANPPDWPGDSWNQTEFPGN